MKSMPIDPQKLATGNQKLVASLKSSGWSQSGIFEDLQSVKIHFVSENERTGDVMCRQAVGAGRR